MFNKMSKVRFIASKNMEYFFSKKQNSTSFYV